MEILNAPGSPAEVGDDFARRVARSRTVAAWLACADLILGLAVVAVWLVRAQHPFELPFVLLMKANTAMCIAGASLAVALLLRGGRIEVASARFLGAFIAVVAVVTLAEYVIDGDFGLDRAVAADFSASYPGRMAPPTTLALSALGVALLLHPSRSRWATIVCDGAIVFAVIVGLVVITAYLYDAPTLYGRTPLTRTSPQTSLALLVACLAMALGRADVGLTRLAMGSGPGSLAVRWLLPLLVVVPIVLGSIRIWAQDVGLVSVPEGLTLVIVSQIVILGAVAFAFAAQLNRARVEVEIERKKREEIENFVTMCAWTKQVKLGGEWISVESYLKDHFGITITHGISEAALQKELETLEGEHEDEEEDEDEPESDELG